MAVNVEFNGKNLENETAQAIANGVKRGLSASRASIAEIGKSIRIPKSELYRLPLAFKYANTRHNRGGWNFTPESIERRAIQPKSSSTKPDLSTLGQLSTTNLGTVGKPDLSALAQSAGVKTPAPALTPTTQTIAPTTNLGTVGKRDLSALAQSAGVKKPAPALTPTTQSKMMNEEDDPNVAINRANKREARVTKRAQAKKKKRALAAIAFDQGLIREEQKLNRELESAQKKLDAKERRRRNEKKAEMRKNWRDMTRHSAELAKQAKEEARAKAKVERERLRKSQRPSLIHRAGRALGNAAIRFSAMNYAISNIMSPLVAATSAVFKFADDYNRGWNMWNIATPSRFTQNYRGGYDRFYDESFDAASRMRMSAGGYRDAIMSAVPIFAATRDLDTGERVVKDIQQAKDIMDSLLLMKSISGTTEDQFQHALIQIIQIASKGKGQMQDLRSILESGGHMGEFLARYGFGTSIGGMIDMSSKGKLLGSEMLRNLASAANKEHLVKRQEMARRTWEDVGVIAQNKLAKFLSPLFKELASESRFGLGSTLLGTLDAMFNPEAQRKLVEYVRRVLEWLKGNSDILANTLPRMVTMLIDLVAGIQLVGNAIQWGFGYLLKGITTLPEVIGTVIAGPGAGAAIGKLTADALGENLTLLSGYADHVIKDAETGMGNALKLGELATALSTPMFTWTKEDMEQWKKSVERGIAKDTALQDEGIVEGLVGLDNNLAKIEKNTRKGTAAQIAILKHVAGARVINRITHVAPNITSNVGTIKTNAQYEELRKQFIADVYEGITKYAMAAN